MSASEYLRKGTENKFRLHKAALNPNLILLDIFLFINILYYFLRFQLPLDPYIVAIYFLVVILISFAVFIKGLRLSYINAPLGAVDIFVTFVLFHSLILTIVTWINTPALDSLLYSAKDYIFPIALYFYCRLYLTRNDWRRVFIVLLFLFSAVSVIYILEFSDKFLLNGGGFVYTEKLTELILKKTGSNNLSTSIIKGDNYALIRMLGPLSHNNVTGLGMAIGAVIGIAFWLYMPSFIKTIPILINIAGLILAVPRTAIFALIISVTLMLVFAIKRGITQFSYIKILAYGSFVLVIVGLISAYIMDWSAYGQVYSFSSIWRAGTYILTIPELSALKGMLADPLTWGGMGFAVPGQGPYDMHPIRSDDLFLVQLISMYGLPGIIFLVIGIFLVGEVIYKSKYLGNGDHLIIMTSLGVLTAILVSTVHTNAMIRPQIFPVFFVALSAIGFYSSKYRIPSSKQEG